MPFKTGNWGEQAKARSIRRKEYFRQYQREQYAKNGDIMRSASLQRNTDNPEKQKARSKAYYHISIPEEQLCEECHIFPAKHRHHPDYTKPFEIQFLCCSCHRKKPRVHASEVK